MAFFRFLSSDITTLWCRLVGTFVSCVDVMFGSALVAGRVVGGATGGAVLGVMQWVVLRRALAHSGWWIPATIGINLDSA